MSSDSYNSVKYGMPVTVISAVLIGISSLLYSPFEGVSNKIALGIGIVGIIGVIVGLLIIQKVIPVGFYVNRLHARQMYGNRMHSKPMSGNRMHSSRMYNGHVTY